MLTLKNTQQKHEFLGNYPNLENYNPYFETLPVIVTGDAQMKEKMHFYDTVINTVATLLSKENISKGIIGSNSSSVLFLTDSLFSFSCGNGSVNIKLLQGKGCISLWHNADVNKPLFVKEISANQTEVISFFTAGDLYCHFQGTGKLLILTNPAQFDIPFTPDYPVDISKIERRQTQKVNSIGLNGTYLVQDNHGQRMIHNGDIYPLINPCSILKKNEILNIKQSKRGAW